MIRSRRRDEGGFTLTELLMYSILMIVVLGLAGTLFVRLLTEQRDIKAMADASNEAQLAFKQLEMDVRNADWAQVDANGTLLVVRTRVATSASSSTPICVGYYYEAGTGTLRRVQTADSGPTVSALSAADASSLEAVAGLWNPVVNSAGTVGAAVVFGPIDGLFDDPDAVRVSMSANANDVHKPIEFVKSISMRKQSGLGSGCR